MKLFYVLLKILLLFIGNINIKSDHDFITLDYKYRQGGYGEWLRMSYVVELERVNFEFEPGMPLREEET